MDRHHHHEEHHPNGDHARTGRMELHVKGKWYEVQVNLSRKSIIICLADDFGSH